MTAIKNSGMGRKLKLAEHLTLEELKQRYRAATDPVESRRWHLLWLVSKHWYVKDAAEVVGIHYDYARKIVHSYNQTGVTSVSNRRQGHVRPRRALLTPEQQQELEQALEDVLSQRCVTLAAMPEAFINIPISIAGGMLKIVRLCEPETV